MESKLTHSVKKQCLSLRGLTRIESFSKFVRMGSFLSGVNKNGGFEWIYSVNG